MQQVRLVPFLLALFACNAQMTTFGLPGGDGAGGDDAGGNARGDARLQIAVGGAPPSDQGVGGLDLLDCGLCGVEVDGWCEPRLGACREPLGPCDAVEVCDGESLSCPDDLLMPYGTVPTPWGEIDDCGAFACDGQMVECPMECIDDAGCAPGRSCSADGICH